MAITKLTAIYYHVHVQVSIMARFFLHCMCSQLSNLLIRDLDVFFFINEAYLNFDICVLRLLLTELRATVLPTVHSDALRVLVVT